MKFIYQNNTSEIDLNDLMINLGKLGIGSVLVEGGSATHGKLLTSKVAHKVYAFIAPKLIGGSDALSPIGGKGFELMKDAVLLADQEVTRFGEDVLITGYIKK